MKQQRWGLVGGGCATLFVALVAAAMGWWQYVSYVPPVAPPAAVIPIPNARDDVLAAIRLLPAGGTLTSHTGNGVGGDRGSTKVPLLQLRQDVQLEAPALQRLRQGFQHEYANLPVLFPAQSFPELAQLRELARALARESELALREGRSGDALRSGLDCVQLSGMSQKQGTLIHGLVAIAVGAIGLRSVENAVETADADSAMRAARELWQLDAEAPGYADVLVGERDSGIFQLAELCRAANLKEAAQSLTSSTSKPTAADLGMMLQFAITPKRKVLENYRRYMEAEIARARKPYHLRGAAIPTPSDPINAIMVPVFENASFTWDRQQAMRRLLATRLALRAYTQREKHPPASLAALVPKYLPALPQDPFASAPLIYRVERGEVVLYSRGPDGDDDGGRDLGSRLQAGSNGDLASTHRIGSQ